MLLKMEELKGTGSTSFQKVQGINREIMDGTFSVAKIQSSGMVNLKFE
jgi:hypothetical protein